MLATTHTAAIRGNLSAIRDEIDGRGLDIKVITLVHDARPGLRGRFRAILQGAEAAYHLATARVFVLDSYYIPLYVIDRRLDTTVVQTWHACGAIKKIGYSVIDKTFGADALLTSMVRIHSNYDVCLAGSAAAVDQYVDAFRQPAELFVTDIGIPRTDVLIRDDDRARMVDAIRRRYAIPLDRRVILFAPTFRGIDMTRARDPQELDLSILAAALGADHVLLMRSHPAVRSAPRHDASLADFVIDVSDYPEVNELLLVTDIVVTDYSSIIFEFALLGRPMAFFAPDLDAYDDERGFYFDYRTGVPAPVFETTEALTSYLRAGVFDLDRVERFAGKWFDVADGHASERFVDQIVLPALSGRGSRRSATGADARTFEGTAP